MFVVRELNREFTFVFGFQRLTRAVGPAKREARVFSGRRSDVANSANGWAGAAECLTREKLLPVTTDAGIVIGKISHVREISFGIPRGRNFVAGIARETFVLIRRMLESGILRGRTAGRLLLRSRL